MGRRVSSGHSLTEYGLLLGLVAVVCIGGLALFGSSLSDLLSGITSGNGQQGGLESYVGSVLTGDQAVAAGQSGILNGSKNAKSGNGTEGLSLNTVSDGGVNATSVDGVGLVHDQADVLKLLAQKIAADPNHDPGILALVTQLANNGHDAATNLAAGIEPYKQALQMGETNDTLTDAEIINTVTATNAFNATYQQLQAYVQANPQALTPDMLKAVNAASSDISNVVSPLVNSNPSSGNDSDKINSSAWNTLASKSLQVHQDSNTICKNGGDTSNCVQ